MPVLARVWLPWVLLALAAGSALVLLVLVAASHLQARDDSQRLAREWAALQQAPDAPGTEGWSADSTADPSRRPPADTAVADDWQQVEPAALPGYLQRLAAEADVALLQFVPQQTAAAPSTARGNQAAGSGEQGTRITLQAQGGLGGIGGFLHALKGPGPVFELLSLRLAAEPGGSGPVCSLMLRIHDADSLHALAADTGAHAADATAAYIPDPHPPLWDDIPPGTLGPAVAVAKAAHVPDVAAPGAGADGPSAAAAPPHGWQLTGLLVGGEASAALIRVPGAGTRTVRTGDALPGTRLRVGDIGDGWLTLREPGGGTHRLALGGVRAGAAVDTGRQR